MAQIIPAVLPPQENVNPTPLTSPVTGNSDQQPADPTPHPKIVAVGTTGVTLFGTIAALFTILNMLFPHLQLPIGEVGVIVTAIYGVCGSIQTLAGYLTSNR